MNLKANNKGFSLVELIIVISIMAVLIGVMAPSFIKYVEASRKSSDINAIATYIEAIETVAIDPVSSRFINTDTVINLNVDNNYSLTFIVADFSAGAELKDLSDALNEIVEDYTLKSTDWRNHCPADEILICTNFTSDGLPDYTLYDFDGADTLLAEHSPDLKAKLDR